MGTAGLSKRKRPSGSSEKKPKKTSRSSRKKPMKAARQEKKQKKKGKKKKRVKATGPLFDADLFQEAPPSPGHCSSDSDGAVSLPPAVLTRRSPRLARAAGARA